MKRWRSWRRTGGGLALLRLMCAVGAAALAGAMLLATHWQGQVSTDLAALNAAVEARTMRQAQARLDKLAAQAATAAVNPQSTHPHADAAASRMADLMALALQHGIVVERTQRRDGERSAAQDRVAITMPVSGAYAELRQFIAEALRSDAALVLERLRLRRADAGAPQFDGEMHWLLLQRPAQGSTP